jgi:electron transfer flavoprotein alpha subunit
MPNEIWVVVEKARHDENIAAISRQLLGKGRELADASGGQLATVVLGSGVGGLAARAFAYGADKAYVVDVEALAQYTTDGFVGAVVALAKNYQPALILTGSSFQMRDFSAALAADLGLSAEAPNAGITARVPPPPRAKGEIIQGTDAAAKVRTLVDKLVESQVI